MRTSIPNMVRVAPPTSEIGNVFPLLCGVGKVNFEYNFGCMAAGDSLFDYRGRFPESSYPMKTYPKLRV